MITYFNQLVSGVPACTQPCSSHPPATASGQVCSLPLQKSLSSSKLAARKARYRMKKIILSCGKSIAPFFQWKSTASPKATPESKRIKLALKRKIKKNGGTQNKKGQEVAGIQYCTNNSKSPQNKSVQKAEKT